jgi:hypothetical protein
MPSQSTYTPIATITNSGYANVFFTNIPQNYTDLYIVCSVNTQQAGSAIDEMLMYYNNDASSGSYSTTLLVGNGSSATSTRDSNLNYIKAGKRPAFATNLYGVININVMNYSNTNTFKTAICRNAADQNGGGTTELRIGLWRSTVAINRIDLVGTANYPGPGSTFTLYGIAAA